MIVLHFTDFANRQESTLNQWALNALACQQKKASAKVMSQFALFLIVDKEDG